MPHDSDIDQYFSARAAGIELPPSSVSTVLDRVARRRRSRRAVLSACSAVAVLGGALAAVDLGGADAPEHVVARPGGGTLVPSTLDWTAVTPRAGLSWASSSVIGPGDALYALSTAPGTPGAVDNGDGSPATLYRSADGREWDVVALPDELRPSSLAGSGDQLYAIGTAAAGGRTSIALAARGATGEWTRRTLPLDLASVEARYGVRLSVFGLGVATSGTRVVATAGVQVTDLSALLPAVLAGRLYNLTDAGIDVYESFVESTPDGEARKREPKIETSYTWAQLGIDATLQSWILGRTFVFAADAGGPLSEVTPPASLRTAHAVLGLSDGFRILGSIDKGSSTIAWTSADGRDWSAPSTAEADGWLAASGIVRDRDAYVVQAPGSGNGTVHVTRPDGSVATLDPVDLVRRSGAVASGRLSVANAAVGPLGVAAIVVDIDERANGLAHTWLVHTADGDTASVTDLTAAGLTGYVESVRVTADAITVTVPSTDGSPTLRLLVGTPR